MRRSTWKWLLWNGAGVALYLLGVLAVALTAISVYLGEPANSFVNLSLGHLLVMMLGVGLIVAGQAVVRKSGGQGDIPIGGGWLPVSREPEQTTLERLGYRLPPEETGDTGSGLTYVDGEVYTVCKECGATNERGFRYCSNCSAELPEIDE